VFLAEEFISASFFGGIRQKSPQIGYQFCKSAGQEGLSPEIFFHALSAIRVLAEEMRSWVRNFQRSAVSSCWGKAFAVHWRASSMCPCAQASRRAYLRLRGGWIEFQRFSGRLFLRHVLFVPLIGDPQSDIDSRAVWFNLQGYF